MSGFPLVADSGQGVVAVCEGSRTGVRWCTYVRARRGGAGRGVGGTRKEGSGCQQGRRGPPPRGPPCVLAVRPSTDEAPSGRVRHPCVAVWSGAGGQRCRATARAPGAGPADGWAGCPRYRRGGWRVCRPCRMRRLRVGCARHLWAMAHAHLLLSARGAAGGGGAAVSAGQRGACVQPGARPRLRVA